MGELPYTPAPRQTAFHEDPRERRWYCAGYGSGKTTAAVLEAYSLATVTHPGHVGIVAAPTHQLLEQGWFREWCRWIPRALWTMRGGVRQGAELSVRTPTGETSTLLLRSTSNPWANEAVNAAWLVFDEAPRERDRSAYEVLLGRLRRGYPGRQRSVLLTGPPQTRKHWTATEYGTGPDAGREGTHRDWHDGEHAVIRARTADNPFLPSGYEAKLRRRPGATKAWCAQYLDAEFGAADGQVFASFSRDVHLVRASSLVGRQWRRVVVGTDWGWAHPGAMIVVAADGMGDLYVLAEEVHRERVVADVPDGWVPIGQALQAAWRANRFVCDPSRPGDIVTIGRGLRGRARVYAADNDLAEGIRRIEARLEAAVERARDPEAPHRPALYVSDACTYLIGELESWSRRKARDGSVTETPEDTGDDACDGLRYGVMDLTRE